MPDHDSDAPENDETIGGDVEMLRGFHGQFISSIEGGGVRPSRQAFQCIADKVTGELAMSVYRADVLVPAGIPFEGIIASRPDYLIVGIPASVFRGVDLGIVPRP